MNHKGVESTRREVTEKVKTFASECLNEGYDVIIPVESEGLSVLLPTLKEAPHLEVIPSGWMQYLDPRRFDGKQVLVVDASVEVGETLQSHVNEFSRLFHCEPHQTAIIAHTVFPEQRFSEARVKPLRLDQNRYEWARQCLAELELAHVFVHSGDPPLWEFSYPPEFLAEVAMVVANLGTTYSVGAFHSWERVSVDLIAPVDKTWLPEEAYIDSACKIRVLLHEQEPLLRVLPLIFPSIPAEHPLSFPRYLRRLQESNQIVPSALVRYADSAAQSPERTFKWIAAYASFLLLRDFLTLLQLSLPGECSLTLKESDVSRSSFLFYDPDFGEELYRCAFDLIAAHLRPPDRTLQPSLPELRFAYKRLSRAEIESALTGSDSEPTRGAPAVVHLEQALALWLWELSHQSSNPAPYDTHAGLTFSDLHALLQPRVTPLALSRALDILVDEAVLRPRVGRRPRFGKGDSNSTFVQRTYAPAGELVRRALLAYAMLVSS